MNVFDKSTSHGICMDGDCIDGCLHPLQRPVVLWIHGNPFKFVQSVPTVDHLPKHCVPWTREDMVRSSNCRVQDAHLRSREGWGAYVRNHWLPLVLGPELAIERTPLVLCFKSSLISSWCQDLSHFTGLLQNKGAPEISLPKCSRPLFQYLLGLQSVPWSPGKSKNVNTANSCLCINSLSSSPWCFVWTCNCCSSLFHTRPGNFHKSDDICFRFIKICTSNFTKNFASRSK